MYVFIESILFHHLSGMKNYVPMTIDKAVFPDTSQGQWTINQPINRRTNLLISTLLLHSNLLCLYWPHSCPFPMLQWKCFLPLTSLLMCCYPSVTPASQQKQITMSTNTNRSIGEASYHITPFHITAVIMNAYTFHLPVVLYHFLFSFVLHDLNQLDEYLLYWILNKCFWLIELHAVVC